MADLGARPFRFGVLLTLLVLSFPAAAPAMEGRVLSYDDEALLKGSDDGPGALDRSPGSFFTSTFYYAYLPLYGLSYWVDGKLGATNCVAWMFERKGYLVVPATAAEEDRLLEAVLESGGEDIRRDGENFEVFTAVDAYEPVRKALDTGGITVATSEVTMVPKSTAADLRTLEDAVTQTAAGNGQVVGVVADAGTGKSRLYFEFAEQCRARGISVRTTTGVSHGKAVPLLPVLDFYRSTFGITERDDASTARPKMAGRVVQADEPLVSALPLLFDFLGVPDPE